MLFEFHAETLGYIISSSITARSEAWPVVEVDNSETAILGYNAVATVDRSLEHRGSPVGSLFQILHHEWNSLRIAVDYFKTELAAMTAL